MRNIEILHGKGLILAILLVLSVLILIIWTYLLWRETQVAKSLTPEAIVQEFQNAGFEIHDAEDMSYYPGPMSVGMHGIKFSTTMEAETIHVLVVLYSDRNEARQVSRAVNSLNERMNGSYGYAFSRGPVVLQVDTRDKNAAREFNAVLKAAE
jgi:hypothetical protein